MAHRTTEPRQQWPLVVAGGRRWRLWHIGLLSPDSGRRQSLLECALTEASPDSQQEHALWPDAFGDALAASMCPLSVSASAPILTIVSWALACVQQLRVGGANFSGSQWFQQRQHGVCAIRNFLIQKVSMTRI